MTNPLLKFWNNVDLDRPPYQHKDDAIKDRRIARKTQFDDRHPITDCELHLCLLPQPYFGSLDRADIVFLLNNPGLCSQDYLLEQRCQAYRSELISTIRQKRNSHLFLDPDWAWTSGGTWWQSKVRDTVCDIAGRWFDGDYLAALTDLSRRVASVEINPYHSVKYRQIGNLASAEAARDFVESIRGKKRIVVLRGETSWSRGRRSWDGILCSRTRSVNLGPKSVGGEAILDFYQKPPPKS